MKRCSIFLVRAYWRLVLLFVRFKSSPTHQFRLLARFFFVIPIHCSFQIRPFVLVVCQLLWCRLHYIYTYFCAMMTIIATCNIVAAHVGVCWLSSLPCCLCGTCRRHFHVFALVTQVSWSLNSFVFVSCCLIASVVPQSSIVPSSRPFLLHVFCLFSPIIACLFQSTQAGLVSCSAYRDEPSKSSLLQAFHKELCLYQSLRVDTALQLSSS